MASYERISGGEYAVKLDGHELFQLYRLFTALFERGGCSPDEMADVNLMFNGACEKMPHKTKDFTDALQAIHLNMHILALSEEIISNMSDLFVAAYEEDTNQVHRKIQ